LLDDLFDELELFLVGGGEQLHSGGEAVGAEQGLADLLPRPFQILEGRADENLISLFHPNTPIALAQPYQTHID
jgi:hypothetical protein